MTNGKICLVTNAKAGITKHLIGVFAGIGARDNLLDDFAQDLEA
jgi:hypothetical protein